MTDATRLALTDGRTSRSGRARKCKRCALWCTLTSGCLLGLFSLALFVLAVVISTQSDEVEWVGGDTKAVDFDVPSASTSKFPADFYRMTGWEAPSEFEASPATKNGCPYDIYAVAAQVDCAAVRTGLKVLGPGPNRLTVQWAPHAFCNNTEDGVDERALDLQAVASFVPLKDASGNILLGRYTVQSSAAPVWLRYRCEDELSAASRRLSAAALFVLAGALAVCSCVGFCTVNCLARPLLGPKLKGPATGPQSPQQRQQRQQQQQQQQPPKGGEQLALPWRDDSAIPEEDRRAEVVYMSPKPLRQHPFDKQVPCDTVLGLRVDSDIVTQVV
mmetsp:Transcript_132766/g.424776  ORF Transcript_132766/g.424776 Transcript_132766/m.424776 type:complete len:331 (+) Transcript_132766:120-1112(+)